ncbi:hypothetical protein C2E21_5577 [Chlorella sorokiniana]|uniref:NYN domain-containing protein n=1 Tax=Chlorella sorokiniana TaxID=3076 RepID=A0A2P6TN79_CHLSO|nr:hypothetical protein C2E21_5577 [Chlorella sorokiniana]|eukprot:PRW50782.1 hypothetical protein C2E21_5577 [Chlorella sorokiniana]
MRLQARWGAGAHRLPAAAAAAASAALPPSAFATGGSLLLRRKAHQRSSGRQLAVCPEARDGKKRRKPQQGGSRDGGSSSDEELLAPARPPPRVDPTNGISPKHQIRWAKLWKDSERQASQGFRQRTPAKAFRQESLDPEEHRRQREEAERIAEEARKRKSDMINLSTMFQTTVSSPGEQPLGVTLIDGYNLLHRWAARQSGVAEWIELARANTPGMLHEAREWLLAQLDVYSALRGMYIHVVYDAMNVGYSSQYNTSGMIVSFRGKETADSYILRQARQYSEQGIQKVCIVSDDLEVALLGPDVVPRLPGQAVFSTSCGALIQLVEEGQGEVLSEADRMEPLRAGKSHLHFSPFTRINVRSKAHNGVARLGGSGGSGGDGAVPGRGIGNLASLRQQLAEREQEAARAAEAQRRQERERERQQRLTKAEQQANQAQQQQAQQQRKQPPMG